jgi:hypothetical protein
VRELQCRTDQQEKRWVPASSRNKGLQFRSGRSCSEVAPFVGRGSAEAARHEAARSAAAGVHRGQEIAFAA